MIFAIHAKSKAKVDKHLKAQTSKCIVPVLVFTQTRILSCQTTCLLLITHKSCTFQIINVWWSQYLFPITRGARFPASCNKTTNEWPNLPFFILHLHCVLANFQSSKQKRTRRRTNIYSSANFLQNLLLLSLHKNFMTYITPTTVSRWQVAYLN